MTLDEAAAFVHVESLDSDVLLPGLLLVRPGELALPLAAVMLDRVVVLLLLLLLPLRVVHPGVAHALGIEVHLLTVLGGDVLILFVDVLVATLVHLLLLVEALVPGKRIVVERAVELVLLLIEVRLLLIAPINFLSAFVALTSLTQMLVERCGVVLLLLSRWRKGLVSPALDKIAAHLVPTPRHSGPRVSRAEHIGSFVLLVVEEHLLLPVLPLVFNDRRLIQGWWLDELDLTSAPGVGHLRRSVQVLLDVHPFELSGRFWAVIEVGRSKRGLLLSAVAGLLRRQLRIGLLVHVIIEESRLEGRSLASTCEYHWLWPILAI